MTSTTVTNPPAGASPVTGTGLTSATLVYDAHGNTTTLADQTLVFDAADRHVSTTSGGTYERFVRDATNRIVQRDAHDTTTTTTRYGYTGGGVP